MEDQEPTVRSRELGLALLRAIEAVGLRQSEVARRMGWSASKVCRMISGKRCASTEDVAAVLAVGKIIGPKRDELLELARCATQPGWWQEYGDRLPPELRTLSDHEDAAITITNFQTAFIPACCRRPTTWGPFWRSCRRSRLPSLVSEYVRGNSGKGYLVVVIRRGFGSLSMSSPWYGPGRDRRSCPSRCIICCGCR